MSKLKGFIKSAAQKTGSFFNTLRELKTISWEDATLGFGGLSAGVLATLGLIGGAVVGAVAIPTILTLAGAQLANVLAAGTTIQAAQLAGISLPAIFGGVAGLVGGLFVNNIPLQNSKVSISEVPQKNQDDNQTSESDITKEHILKLKNGFELALNYKGDKNIRIVMQKTGTLTGGLAGAFTGAVAGVTLGTTCKLTGHVIDKTYRILPSFDK